MSFKSELHNLPKSFSIQDLNQIQLHVSVKREAEYIFNGPYARNYRSLDKIIEDTIVGHAAEQHLIQTQNFTDNNDKYNDIISPEGHKVEVKVINYKWCNLYRIETDPKKMNLKLWTEKYKSKLGHSSRYVLVYSVQDGMYDLFGGYDLETQQRL